ncbi:hypothetical protein EDM57_04710 [Brevibacillus gelatini]|uniref:Uncharacterized protein n=1 Tax=Brevibacillus gelatini TaxID=1655277 RepID=A0A3M8B8Z5_9BACL|nr:hypothetical protein [Brevibacillus gelatini]RNB59447.1 hypothetical protein EDM57_04710 [Brevibacillus gelatini]
MESKIEVRKMQPFQDGELELLREYVLLPIVLTIFERDKKNIEESEISIKQPYVTAINEAMYRITRQLSKLKNEMYRKGLRVVKETRTEHGIDCLFLCRGYSQQFQMLWDFVKAETEVRMQQYLMGMDSHS